MSDGDAAKTLEEVRDNNPPIKIGQVWVARIEEKIMRRVRVLAPYPKSGLLRERNFTKEDKLWIYEELGGGIFRTEIGRLGIFPEFNLRYVCELEITDD